MIYLLKGEAELPREPEIRLGLYRHSASDNVILAVVDKEGRAVPFGNLLEFRRDGTVSRFRGVSTAFGLPIAPTGELIIAP